MAPTSRDKSGPPMRVRAGAVVLALALTVINVHWVIQVDAVHHVNVITKLAITYNAVFSLMLLAAANLLLRRLAPRLALNPAEMVVTYTSMFLASSVAGLDMMQPLFATVTHPFWFATPENGWEQFWPLLPDALTMRDPRSLHDLYEGGTSFLDPRNLRPWVTPALIWSLLLALLFAVMTGLNALIRRRWMDGEKLSFPLIELPLEMSVNFGRLMSHRLLWIGFAAALTIDLLAGLSELYPLVPHLDVRSYQGVRVFDQLPWSAVGSLEFGTPPFLIGLGYFLPVPVLFSCWFFFVFTLLQRIACAILGLHTDRRMPYLAEQTFGAYAAIAALVFVNARRYWGQVLARAAGGRSELDDSDEPLRYRTALLMAVGGFAGLVLFSNVFGMRTGYALGFFAVYFVTSLTITRIRAELGPPAHDLPAASPGEILINLGGTGIATEPDRALSAMYLWFTRGYRTHPMAVQLEGFKMAERIGMSQATILSTTWLSYLVTIIATFWGMLWSMYRYGEATAMVRGESVPFGNQAYGLLDRWLTVRTSTDWRGIGFAIAGAVFTAGLNWGKLTYPWWPFFPVGYALQGGWMMRHIWFGLLVTWVIKTALLRYGGGNIYRRAAPLFMGLVLGEFTMAAVWSLIAIGTGIHVWSFWS